MNERIKYSPRTGDDMIRATLNAPIHLYSDLCRRAKQIGVSALLHQMSTQPNHVILLQDPDNMRSGHWTSLSFHPEKHAIYFFSTYGGKPDVEKITWLSKKDLLSSGQDINLLNDGLQQLQKREGWVIHYNDHPYQTIGDNTATCGIYTAAFLRSGKNPDEFWQDTRRIKQNGEDPCVVYYKKYFL